LRPVNNNQLLRAANLDALNAANAAIGTAAQITWERFLEEHKQEATALRTGLWAIGCMKCWFSEAFLQQGEGHIEHYRPKGRLSGVRHLGYKWRTFDWSNLRFAHQTVNFRRTDFLAQRLMGKGSYFPIRDPARRANRASEEINEEPVLLDPVIPSDTLLIAFDEASGAPRPRFSKEQNDWLHRRASESIDYYHLNEGTWNYKRADKMASVRVLCDQLEQLAAAAPRDEENYNKKIDEILGYIGPFAEFSSACLQVVREKGLLEQVFPGLD
jgi:hypothetical protein